MASLPLMVRLTLLDPPKIFVAGDRPCRLRIVVAHTLKELRR